MIDFIDLPKMFLKFSIIYFENSHEAKYKSNLVLHDNAAKGLSEYKLLLLWVEIRGHVKIE